MIETIEFHCPACASITPIVPGIVACLGCNAPLLLIAIHGGKDAVQVKKTVEEVLGLESPGEGGDVGLSEMGA